MSTTINGFHLFTVKEYSRLKEMDAGSCISSDIFTVGGYDWQVYFHPNGSNFKTDSGYVSVFLRMVNGGPEVEASFEYTLLDQSGKGLLIMPTTINGFHLFTVKEYSRLKEKDVGSYISSDTFTVGGYDWKISFYPNGYDKKDTGYVSLFLYLVNDGPEVEASLEYTLLDQSGKGVHDVNNISTGLYKKGTRWGQYFMKKQDLESSDYLKDDSLSICCMVRVVQSCIRPKYFTIIPPPPEMEKDFKYLLDSEIGSDIVFRVKDVTFKAHKVILAARSPVFKAQFYGLVGNPPALDEVELMDIEPSVFKAMILFIYSDNFPDSQESMGSMSNMIQNLLVAADRFGLDRLKQLCEAKLCEELNVDVVATTLSLAHDHHCSQLKTLCMDFAAANLREVIQTEGYKYVEKSCPLVLLELLPKIAELLQKTASEN